MTDRTERGQTVTATVRWTDDDEQLVLTIPRSRLETHLADLLGRPVELTQVMFAVRNSGGDAFEASAARRSPRLQAVLAHMETHAAQPLTPGELARVGCMSVRALHATFRHELGVSPMAHLRRIRLDRVHADLVRGTEPQRIGDVATRWGFFHPSRFARQYHERFGELPSDTARRRAG